MNTSSVLHPLLVKVIGSADYVAGSLQLNSCIDDFIAAASGADCDHISRFWVACDVSRRNRETSS